MEFTANEVKQLVQKNYLLCSKVETLQGYDEFNYKITDVSGRKFYPEKITGKKKRYSFLMRNSAILEHLSVSAVAWNFQQILPQ